MPELESCPRCGAAAEMRSAKWRAQNHSIYRVYWAACKRCETCTSEYTSAKKAADAWNREAAKRKGMRAKP